jgi:hypothetical protein
MRRLLFIMTLAATVAQAWAQYDDEYKMEVGAGVGTSTYLGDFNGNITSGAQPLGALVLKRVINPYMGVAAQLAFGKLKGSSANVKTYYPELQGEPYTFSNTVAGLDVRYEYNFWPYGTGRDYLGAKRLTPFVFGGLGLAYADAGEAQIALAMPLGMGVKYKVAPRLNLSLEWAMHFTNSDKLDGKADPYVIESTGLMKNSDGFSTLLFTLTYSFMPKCRVCHNADE